jgi:hypothetical protein
MSSGTVQRSMAGFYARQVIRLVDLLHQQEEQKVIDQYQASNKWWLRNFPTLCRIVGWNEMTDQEALGLAMNRHDWPRYPYSEAKAVAKRIEKLCRATEGQLIEISDEDTVYINPWFIDLLEEMVDEKPT